MEQTPRLGVVMIAKNEAHCIANCLESVRAIADEIVVGDTGSTDGTVDVAERHGARIISIPWTDDFAAARNLVLSEAEGDWLLHLDADEVLDLTSAERIRRLVDEDGGGADALELAIANYCDEPRAWLWVACSPGDPMTRGFTGFIETHLLRLFRNRRGFEYREPVHENITESVRERGGAIQRVPVTIHHYGYRSHGSDPRKARVYLDMNRRKVRGRPGDPKAWHDLAEQALALGETAEAESACRTALNLDPHHLGAGTTLANILCNRGDLGPAQAVLDVLLTAGHRLPHVLTALGAIKCRQGEPDSALALLGEAAEMAPPSLMALLHYARALDLAGRISEARAVLEQALEIGPALTEVQNRLSAHRLREREEASLRAGEYNLALKAIVDALRLDPEDPLLHRDTAVALDALGDRDRAAASRDRARRLAAVYPPFQ